ncbi:MAG: ATP-dependent zinc metalloprotease FtsH [bacterium ADurb.Bin400]|nr:MAG: ATP-dependent zinc metalloprotease FtsH [bacterium ADurb.Bin400]
MDGKELMKINVSKVIIYVLILLLVGSLFASVISMRNTEIKEVPISEIAQGVESGEIKEVTVRDNTVTATQQDGDQVRATKEPGISLTEYGITPEKARIEVQDTSGSAAWFSILSLVLPILLIGGFIWFMMRSAQGANSKAMGFGKSTARVFMGNTKVTFKDVAGQVEPKQELVEVVEFLKNPKKFHDLGAEIPRGVLLVGPPGTGKTMLAKAVAGEAGVPFFSISASEFVEMFVGVGASRVRDLFLRAKRNAPAIIFIDELDAIGRQRGAGLGGSHDEREQTLNQILVEMDGFDTNDNVIVVAATNRPDVLDPALLRPGRFDRRVVIDLPDRIEREEILKVHTKKKPVETEVSLGRVAAITPGFSGADLRNITNEAAILAARDNRKIITQKDFSEAIEKVMMGPERRSRMLSDQEKRVTAIHEAGHAVVSHILPNSDPVQKISIISRGMALGYTWNMPLEDRRLQSKVRFEDEISSLMGGRVAEEEFFGGDNITTGAQNDLKRATEIARKMVTEFGMSDRLGPQTYGNHEEMPFLGKDYVEHRNYSDKIASLIDEEVAKIINNAKTKAQNVISTHKKTLEKIADALLAQEVLEADEFEQFFTKTSKQGAVAS